MKFMTDRAVKILSRLSRERLNFAPSVKNTSSRTYTLGKVLQSEIDYPLILYMGIVYILWVYFAST